MKRGAVMQRTGIIILAVSTLATVLLLTASAPKRGSLVWNYTPSMPLGLYRIEDRQWSVGERVAVMPSGKLADILAETGALKAGRVLLKRVAAVEGDRVCRADVAITINSEYRATAQQDVLLPTWTGCSLLQAGEVFLLGEADNSFDGRYFGVSSAADIIGPAQALITF